MRNFPQSFFCSADIDCFSPAAPQGHTIVFNDGDAELGQNRGLITPHSRSSDGVAHHPKGCEGPERCVQSFQHLFPPHLAEEEENELFSPQCNCQQWKGSDFCLDPAHVPALMRLPIVAMQKNNNRDQSARCNKYSAILFKQSYNHLSIYLSIYRISYHK